MTDVNDIIFVGGFFLAFILIVSRIKNDETQTDESPPVKEPMEASLPPSRLVYQGDELNFPDEIITGILNKHFPYFKRLSDAGRVQFLTRLKKFIAIKTFIIHDRGGFREMPILLSAAAVKLSMGLKQYMLPHYKFIHIFPAEFIGVVPTFRILTGNVSGNSINISWKHFLEGFQYPEDGQNVGLHEMAHAYYYQYFETGKNIDGNFVEKFPAFNSIGNKIFEQEKSKGTAFYSSYALKNFQEFWAESVELFFERPMQFKAAYPELYAAMVEILNQDPAE